MERRIFWGVSSSAFQFEMGDSLRRFIDPNTDWWAWVRDPKNIFEGLVSGDLPEDGVDYAEYYPKDHELARSLSLDVYRVTVEWSRIFPYPTSLVEVDVERDGLGFIKDVRISEETLRHLDRIASKRYVSFYRELIADLRKRGFKVIVNLNHFTLPIWLHDPLVVRDTHGEEGPRGYAEEMFVTEFTKFAAYVAWKFGDLVDLWSTFNEPMVMVELGFLSSTSGFPPGIRAPRLAARALHNHIIAHARAYDAIKRFDRVKAYPDSREPAEIGVIHNIIPPYPLDSSDASSCDSYNYFRNKLILEAWVRGVMDVHLDGKSLEKLPHLGNKLDWLGINYYTRVVIKKSEKKVEEIPLLNFEGVEGYGYACLPNGASKDGRPCSDFGWEVYPEGFLDTINIGWEYKKPIFITENGIADHRDLLRPYYIVNHVYVMEKALESGVDIRGYLHWALTDNYEWASGFRLKFGLFEVDLLTKERKPRFSATLYRRIVENNGVPEDLKSKYLLSDLKVKTE
ncbi:beta-galactosidase BgaS [Infirmifilum sp. NZ]|uniref:beta-galactosidase BgaS n=1 Tax=Infirmifilum sp. NZ TaxID=2926850 RepID=UPI0027A6664F|nr:beta-galactosidase BgaS [Infirmifilum sp. NZ]UNQ73328.1 glycoside hydrolase family 1 protein [Infirmifilum sp. NZ]